MPASLERTRERMKVAPTARDAGLNLTIDVTAYDNGLIQVDGVPINNPAKDPDPSGHGWLGAAETILIVLGEFRRQVQQRTH
jgi:hypothetical protein